MIGIFSTHARKLICTGEGGFCLTSDPALADQLRPLRNLGQPPGGGAFGVGFGLNYKLPALAAAFGRVQLSRLTSRLAQRGLILSKLTTMASEITGLEPFPIPQDTEPNGYAALFTGPGLDSPDGADEPLVIAPLWIVEQQVPAERREPEPHIHVDHLYLALAETSIPALSAELPFVWYSADRLTTVDMFSDTRVRAAYLLDRIDVLADTTTYDRVSG